VIRAALILLLVGVAGAVLSGCVRRTVAITTDPPGALVWVNDREVGRTPVEIDFVYYGRYDVRLELDGYEPRMTSGRARAPLWDVPPIDFAAEIAPVEFLSRTRWHYDLEPVDDDQADLLERALGLRAEIEGP
jgi:hypothetical protein